MEKNDVGGGQTKRWIRGHLLISTKNSDRGGVQNGVFLGEGVEGTLTLDSEIMTILRILFFKHLNRRRKKVSSFHNVHAGGLSLLNSIRVGSKDDCLFVCLFVGFVYVKPAGIKTNRFSIVTRRLAD